MSASLEMNPDKFRNIPDTFDDNSDIFRSNPDTSAYNPDISNYVVNYLLKYAENYYL